MNPSVENPRTARRYDRYEVWAPSATRVSVRIDGTEHEMSPGEQGWFMLPEVTAVPGSRYAFQLDGGDLWLPDPRSLSQPDGVHGASEVIDPRRTAECADRTVEGPGRPTECAGRPTEDTTWEGRDLRGRVLYELHVGTFTPGPDGHAGTFDAAIERLGELVDLGVDAIELMPIATFPGHRGWGYDGVGLYATHADYGGPAGLTRFVSAAHAHGLAVVLDVVHNHLGPSGNYLGMFGPYFTDRHETPWGEAVNLDQSGSRQVRDFLLGSARQWLVDMGIDGLRLDAVHELHDASPRHFLAELAESVSRWEAEVGRPLTLIAESDRNDPVTVTPTGAGGLGMDMQWADDVHHGVHAWITGEREGYYVDFGAADALATVLTTMFLHAGTYSTFRGRVWGSPVDPGSTLYDAHSFVTFLQNHDQVGNRATGDRIHRSLTPAQHAAAISLILLGPGTPMLFQGEEWAASTPFTFFTDHDDELGPLVSAGRAEEFTAMGWEGTVPDPQDVSTFESSILRHEERETGDHARILDWYRQLIALRRTHHDVTDPDLRRTRVEILAEQAVLLRRGQLGILAHRGPGALAGTLPGALRAREILTSFGDVSLSPEGIVQMADAGAAILRLDAE